MAIKPEAIQSLLAILIIGILALVAINYNVDGDILRLSIIAIAGLGGYELYKRANGTSPK